MDMEEDTVAGAVGMAGTARIDGTVEVAGKAGTAGVTLIGAAGKAGTVGATHTGVLPTVTTIVVLTTEDSVALECFLFLA